MRNKITIVIFMLGLIFLSSTVFAQDFAKIAQANFSGAKGESLYEAGRYDEAIAPLEDIINVLRPARPARLSGRKSLL
jgi:hypothetical protein